jgi:hypothetical protein
MNYLIGFRNNEGVGLLNPFVIVVPPCEPYEVKDGMEVQVKRPFFQDHDCEKDATSCYKTKHYPYVNVQMVRIASLEQVGPTEFKVEPVPDDTEEYCETVYDFVPPLETLPNETLVWDSQKYGVEYMNQLSAMELDTCLLRQGYTEEDLVKEKE